ncbi:MAG TPA: ABC transporter permease subunit [Candidatus Limnocylindrales bacterium]
MTGPGFGGRFPDAVDSVASAMVPHPRAKPRRRLGTIVWWLVFLLGFLYFFVPLLGTFLFSMREEPLFSAYAIVVNDPQFAQTLFYSFLVGVITIIASSILIVPTAFWVRLRLPRLRPYIEFITLLPFVIPPIILVFGLIKSYSGSNPLPLAGSDFGSNILLVAAYVVLSFPYMYRAVDTGLRAIDVRSLTEASQSLGAGWFTLLWRVIFPNLRVSLLSGAFLTLAIVVGEYTIATFLARPAFGPYIALIGGNLAYEPAAVSLISFALTWIAMGLLALVGRESRQKIQIAGAH